MALSTNKAKLKKRLRLFWQQRGLCYFCNCQMVIDRIFYTSKNTPLPPHAATLDHLDSRLSPERGKHSGERRIVLACNKCNFERGRAEEIEFLKKKKEEEYDISISYRI